MDLDLSFAEELQRATPLEALFFEQIFSNDQAEKEPRYQRDLRKFVDGNGPAVYVELLAVWLNFRYAKEEFPRGVAHGFVEMDRESNNVLIWDKDKLGDSKEFGTSDGISALFRFEDDSLDHSEANIIALVRIRRNISGKMVRQVAIAILGYRHDGRQWVWDKGLLHPSIDR